MSLRKVWKSFRRLSTSPSSPSSPSSHYKSNKDSERWRGDDQSAASDDFESMTRDVLLVIFGLAGPQACARAASVCTSWRSVALDDSLWLDFLRQECPQHSDAFIFSEQYLRGGPSLVRSIDQDASELLPFNLIYSQRKQLQVSVIIDGGSGYCKYGLSNNSKPTGKTITFLEFGNIETPVYSRLRHFFTTVYSSKLQLKPSAQSAIVSFPIYQCDDSESAKAARRQLREAMYSVLFDMNVPSVCTIDQAVLALYASQRTSGIVINIGFQVTSVVPILFGKIMRNVGVEVIGLGGLHLTGFLSQLLHDRSTSVPSMETARILKENLCYVADDYELELTKNVEASLFVVGEGMFTLSTERFRTGEILFQPKLAGLRTMSLHRAVALCIDHCDAYKEGGMATKDWFKTVIMTGGTACLPGLAERLEKELYQTLPSDVAKGIKVLGNSHGADSAWFGAKIIGNLSTFPRAWCITKKQYRRHGANIIHSMALEDN